MDVAYSLTYSQQPATNPLNDPDETSPGPSTLPFYDTVEK